MATAVGQTHTVRAVLRNEIPKLIKKHLLVFMKAELGHLVADHHKQWWEKIKDGDDALVLAPRDHGKSHTLVRCLSIWKAKYDPWIKEVLILGGDNDAAINNLDKIKEIMLAAPSLKHLLPRDRKNFNSRKEIRLTNGVVIKTKAVFSPIRGRHPQLIILDDVANEKNSMTKEMRDKVEDYFWRVVMPMKDKGTPDMQRAGYKPQIVIVGTAQNEEDIYFTLAKNSMFQKTSLIQSAIVDPDKQTVLWPDRYTWESLMQLKAGMGPLKFAQEYCNEPISDETSLFPTALFEPLKDRNRSYVMDFDGSAPAYLGVDFSVPGDQGGDWTVALAARKVTGDVLEVMGYWREKPETMARQIEKIADMTKRLKITVGYLEANLFQKVYPEHFKKYTNLPLKGHVVTASGKNSLIHGVLSFRPLFENLKITFPYKTAADQEKTDQIVREFGGMMKKDGKLGNFRHHDDCVMALWHMLSASRQVPFSYSI